MLYYETSSLMGSPLPLGLPVVVDGLASHIRKKLTLQGNGYTIWAVLAVRKLLPTQVVL